MSSVSLSSLERVSVSLPVAGIGYRTLAYLVDALLLFLASAAAYFALSLLVSDLLGMFQALSSLAQVVLVVGVFAAMWIYWTACEALWRGQTVGKRLLGIRVVRIDGSPVGIYESAVRNLLRLVDFLPALYGFGVLSMLMTEQHRRLGDLVAGTVLVREEQIALEKYLEPQATQVPRLGAALKPEDAELVIQFLDRAPQLLPEARERLARALIERYGAELTPDQRVAALSTPEAFLRSRVS